MVSRCGVTAFSPVPRPCGQLCIIHSDAVEPFIAEKAFGWRHPSRKYLRGRVNMSLSQERRSLGSDCGSSGVTVSPAGVDLSGPLCEVRELSEMLVKFP